ncbi:hypothetical protein BDV95DRAFT_608456 [Massariosphaeria phaeospora]|uniref:Uncharacterized protein n=1 Tax=Massariosphaeria phaeospora TaxID=100035 RepID=A0A7C8I347_9PLEO|nr:hypothetical protein BDV95DRAFT_608456 [Massariosphaeria phaeospora]
MHLHILFTTLFFFLSTSILAVPVDPATIPTISPDTDSAPNPDADADTSKFFDFDCGRVTFANGVGRPLLGLSKGHCWAMSERQPVKVRVHEHCVCFFYVQGCNPNTGAFTFIGWGGRLDNTKPMQRPDITSYYCQNYR